MPQGNLDTLVYACAGGSHDNKIVCESLAATESVTDGNDDHLLSVEKPVEEEIAPESFWLSKDAEFDWFDRNAFYERKESHKGNSAPNSTNLNPSLNSNTNSQRFSLRKSKASIIGLPKPQKPCYVEPKNRKITKPGNTRLFPKRSGSVKSDRPLVEPSSPKVSCIGRVRSKRDRKKREQKPTGVETVNEKTTGKRTSLFSSFRSIFRHKSNGKASEAHAPAVGNRDIRSRLPPDDNEAISIEPETMEINVVAEPHLEPVSLGGMKRFASGRRSEPLI
ncbi:putative inosine-uridine preferring nucleoside hydrolase [Hibiscus syriacus]|uniref:Inosine-uridine preferring nucleoside hydrolase n=1 Tax=Hibiscus syriacus TaxID=106335 RepID=A0A6A3BNN9_HIBSY|nr:uncharacterized protein LOC120214463 [Hibiscus syriacus]KAE8717048.1 putative inosine-uridine preferring nucleoside hydrolase [Hibiscus syriacus]